MDDILKVKEEVSNEMKSLRAFDRLLNGDLFERAWIEAGEDSKKLVLELIKKRDDKAVRKWIRDQCYDTATYQQLRTRAHQLGIQRYSRLSKDELIVVLYQEEMDGRPDHQSDSNGCPRNEADTGKGGIQA